MLSGVGKLMFCNETFVLGSNFEASLVLNLVSKFDYTLLEGCY